MEKRVKKTKKSNDFSRLSHIKEKPINIKSIMKFNIFNTIIVVLLIYFVFTVPKTFLVTSSVSRSPVGNPILDSMFKFILLAALVLTLLGWIVLAYYKRLNNERPN